MLPLGKQRFLPAPGFPQEASNDPTETFQIFGKFGDQGLKAGFNSKFREETSTLQPFVRFRPFLISSLRSIPCHSMLGTFGQTFLQSARSERFELFTVTLHGRPHFILDPHTSWASHSFFHPQSTFWRKFGWRMLSHVLWNCQPP